jgi:hypothetical protein
MQTQLSDAELQQRKDWEEHAPNAFRQPDQEVLAMIKELQERRAAEKAAFPLDHLAEGSH